MLNPEATLRELAEELAGNPDRVGLALDDFISKARARRLLALAIRATHEILHPGCRLDPVSLSHVLDMLERE